MDDTAKRIKASRVKPAALTNVPPVAARVCDITAVVAHRLRAISKPSSPLRRDSASFAQLGPVSGSALS